MSGIRPTSGATCKRMKRDEAYWGRDNSVCCQYLSTSRKRSSELPMHLYFNQRDACLLVCYVACKCGVPSPVSMIECTCVSHTLIDSCTPFLCASSETKT